MQTYKLVDAINEIVSKTTRQSFIIHQARSLATTRTHSYLRRLRDKARAENKPFSEYPMFDWVEYRFLLKKINDPVMVSYESPRKDALTSHLKIIHLPNLENTPRVFVAQSIFRMLAYSDRHLISEILCKFDSIEDAYAAYKLIAP